MRKNFILAAYLLSAFLALLLVGCLGRTTYPDELYPNVKRLTQNIGPYFSPRWSPDGTKLALVKEDGKGVVYVMNSDGGELTAITDPNVSSGNFDWSPDGKQLVVAATNGISIVNLDGTVNSRSLTGSTQDACPRWSPDGKRIAFCRPTRAGPLGERNEELYVMDVDGSHLTQLTFPPLGYVYFFEWSPDGAEIVFRADHVEADGLVDLAQGGGYLYLMNADGTNLREIDGGLNGSFEPTWAPDGQHILFSYFGSIYKASPNTGFYLIDKDGTGRRTMIENLACQSPNWSRRGNQVVFRCYSASLSLGYIFTMDMNAVLR